MVHDEIISDFVKQSFLDPNDDRIIDKVLDIVIPGVGRSVQKVFSRNELREKLKQAQEKVLEGAPEEVTAHMLSSLHLRTILCRARCKTLRNAADFFTYPLHDL
jgi:hypothetical protein